MDNGDTPHFPLSGNRVKALLVGLAIGATMLLSLAPPAAAADFSANPATLGEVPDGAAMNIAGPPRNVEFNVSGLQAPISDVQVTFSFNPAAAWVGDLNVLLIAPGGGASHSIFGRTGISGGSPFGDNSDALGPYTFADSAPALPKWWDAAAAVDMATPVASGSYRASTLGTDPGGGSSTLITPTFAGLASPNGVWTLQLTDNANGGGTTGTVSAATLRLAAPAIPPSNDFTFGKLKRNKQKGTATLTVDVPGAGTLALGGKGIVKQRAAAGGTALTSKAVGAAGKVKLKVKAKGKKKDKLNDTGKVKVKAKVTFTPTGGVPATQTKRITLKKD